MTTTEIRTKFIDFFVQRDHRVIPSALLNPETYGDKTTMLTSAGMQPLVPFFKAESAPPHSRIVSCQKCCRADDVEEVGRTWRHATFFEMLGNFSFGDYFKKEAIEWGYEFVTDVLEIPREVLWFSVYQEDDEAEAIWKNHIGIPADRVLRFGRKDNWWVTADRVGRIPKFSTTADRSSVVGIPTASPVATATATVRSGTWSSSSTINSKAGN